MGRSRYRPATPTEQLFFGLIFAVMGIFLVLGGLGLAGGGFPQKPWLTIIAGLFCFTPGAGIVLDALHRMVSEHRSSITYDLVIPPIESGKGLFGTWIAALTFLFLVLMFWGAIFQGVGGRGNMPEWMLVAIVTVFSMVTLVLLAYAIWLTMGALRYGRLPLHLTGYPCVGDKLRAYIELPRGFSAGYIDTTLKCYKIDLAHAVSGDPLGTVNELGNTLQSHWHQSKAIAVSPHGIYSRVNIEFDVPANLPAANWYVYTEGKGDSGPGNILCRWELKISAQAAGPDMSRTYELPVQAGSSPVSYDETNDLSARRQNAICKVVTAQLETGISPEDIVFKMERLGIPGKNTQEVFQSMLKHGTCPASVAVEHYLADQVQINRELETGQLMLLRRGNRDRPDVKPDLKTGKF